MNRGDDEMTYEILIGALGFIGALAVIVKPLITLNNNITALTLSVNQLKEVLDELKTRVNTHGHEIDEIKEKVTGHEVRIRNLESRDPK